MTVETAACFSPVVWSVSNARVWDMQRVHAADLFGAKTASAQSAVKPYRPKAGADEFDGVRIIARPGAMPAGSKPSGTTGKSEHAEGQRGRAHAGAVGSGQCTEALDVDLSAHSTPRRASAEGPAVPDAAPQERIQGKRHHVTVTDSACCGDGGLARTRSPRKPSFAVPVFSDDAAALRGSPILPLRYLPRRPRHTRLRGAIAGASARRAFALRVHRKLPLLHSAACGGRAPSLTVDAIWHQIAASVPPDCAISGAQRGILRGRGQGN